MWRSVRHLPRLRHFSCSTELIWQRVKTRIEELWLEE